MKAEMDKDFRGNVYIVHNDEALWIDYPNYRIRHNKDMLPLFIEKPMMYPKGEKFQYG